MSKLMLSLHELDKTRNGYQMMRDQFGNEYAALPQGKNSKELQYAMVSGPHLDQPQQAQYENEATRRAVTRETLRSNIDQMLVKAGLKDPPPTRSQKFWRAVARWCLSLGGIAIVLACVAVVVLILWTIIHFLMKAW